MPPDSHYFTRHFFRSTYSKPKAITPIQRYCASCPANRRYTLLLDAQVPDASPKLKPNPKRGYVTRLDFGYPHKNRYRLRLWGWGLTMEAALADVRKAALVYGLFVSIDAVDALIADILSQQRRTLTEPLP